MARLRPILGIIAAAMLVLSSAAHSLLGWTQLAAALRQSGAAGDLITGLAIGWHFAGVAMLVFGVLVAWSFVDALRGRPASHRTALVVGIVYLLFGAWALVVSGMDPFFLVFLVPGALLVVAAAGRVSPPLTDAVRA